MHHGRKNFKRKLVIVYISEIQSQNTYGTVIMPKKLNNKYQNPVEIKHFLIVSKMFSQLIS